jgi:voltage-gated potassium channel
MASFREKVDTLLNDEESRFAQIYDIFSTVLVLLVCFIFVLGTYPISFELQTSLSQAEFVITCIFLVEYIMRFWSKRFSLKFFFSPMALVDLLAILPLFLGSSHWQFVRVLRITRILRILRLLQHHTFFFGKVEDFHLRITRILFTLFCLVFISAGMIYDIEHVHNPEVVSTFFDAIYFSIVTLTTVGYGDITPISFGGRVVTLLMIVTGAILIPVQITGMARSLFLATRKKQVNCKHCGLIYHDPDASHCKACGNLIYQETLGDVPY